MCVWCVCVVCVCVVCMFVLCVVCVCVWYVCVCVCVCTILLPPGVNPIAVNKYINMSINTMEPDNSWPCSQQPAICSSPAPTVSNPLPLTFTFFEFHPIASYHLRPNLRSCFFPSSFTIKPNEGISVPPHACHIPCSSHPPSFDNPKIFWFLNRNLVGAN